MGAVDAHDTAEEVMDFHLLAAVFAEESGDAVLGGVSAERIEDVAVSRSVPTEKKAEKRDNQPKVGKVGGSPDGIARLAEIKDEEAATGLEDAEEF